MSLLSWPLSRGYCHDVTATTVTGYPLKGDNPRVTVVAAIASARSVTVTATAIALRHEN
jgi:hypothetical protein